MTKPSQRPRLVPKTTIVATAIIVGLLITAGIGAYLVSRAQLVEVPDVAGVPVDEAEAVLADAGLESEIGATQVSVNVAAGSVISQGTQAGSRVKPGTLVVLVVSAGPQTQVVPDLIGSHVEGAKDVLGQLGFKVVVEMVSSETTDAIVLEMFPAPGTSVNVGDVIRLTIPGEATTEDVLLPYDLQGVLVLLDPQPPVAGLDTDVSMEVARRLQALLEAAGATVHTTRQASGSSSDPAERRATAENSTADLMIGIDVSSSGKSGITVVFPDQTSDRSERSVAYARAITRAASLPSLVVNEPVASLDPVLAAFPGAGVRVVVGDSAVPADVQQFRDPNWADQVARAIYRGVGTAIAAE